MKHENLWAPWRMQYIERFAADPTSQQGGSAPDQSCFLCEAVKTASGSDLTEQSRVLLCDDRGIILLNLYPYTNGHLLVAPCSHTADLTDLSDQQRTDLMTLTVLAQRVLRAAANPQGFNIGINLGRCAGAGLPGHLHVHVVPRWSGDTNYMETVGRVRVIPEALERSYARMAEALAQIESA